VAVAERSSRSETINIACRLIAVPEIEVVQGDITEERVDAIVNAANSSLLGGGGVDGAIHRAGGPEILAACRHLRDTELRDGLPTGHAVATPAGLLPARWVIHTVGPIYAAVDDPASLLTSCHRESLRVADELGARSVAFPAISCGVYGYPVDEAAPIAIGTVRGTPTSVELVRFVLFDTRAFDTFQRCMTP
jgi:O-acetyl-ADP-ribose deacetylase